MRLSIVPGAILVSRLFGSPSLAAEAKLVLPDEVNYTRGEYLAYASPWSRFYDPGLSRPRDYEDSIELDQNTFPDNTLIRWRWPAGPRPKGAGVWGYLHIAFGDFSGGRTAEAVPPSRVAAIEELSVSFDYSFTGSRNFNLLTETFLTEQPGDQRTRRLEVGFLLHAPEDTLGFHAAGAYLGLLDDNEGRTWSFRRHEPSYVTILPSDAAAVTKGRVDFKRAFDFLVSKNVLTGREWFNGAAFGVEPTIGGGEGSLAIARLSVSYRAG